MAAAEKGQYNVLSLCSPPPPPPFQKSRIEEDDEEERIQRSVGRLAGIKTHPPLLLLSRTLPLFDLFTRFRHLFGEPQERSQRQQEREGVGTTAEEAAKESET